MSTLKKVRHQCRWPLFGKIFREYYGYYLTSNLAILLQHGFSLHEICQLTNKFDDDSLLHQVGQAVFELSSQGRQLTDLILKAPFLPDELAIFINRGLTNEQLGQELTLFSKLKFKKISAVNDAYSGIGAASAFYFDCCWDVFNVSQYSFANLSLTAGGLLRC